MSKIIKSGDAGISGYAGYQREAFLEHADEPIVEGFDEQEVDAEPVPSPEEILAAARAEAEAKVREAYEEGYRRGEERGLADFQAHAGEAISVMEQVAEAIAAERRAFVEGLEPQVVALVRYMTEKTIRKEWEQDETTVLRMARQALEKIVDAQKLTVRVHPDDVAIVREHKAELLDGLSQLGNVTIAVEESIVRGGCLIETETLVVDATFQSQLLKILEAL